MRTVVIIPTYNEREALPITLAALRADVPEVDVLIVDDNSPDGTGRWADEYAAGDPRVQVLHRSSKDGLGRAYIAGFRWALARGYASIVEMDADSSHRSLDLPALLRAAADGADLVIGSRWVPGGAVENWPLHRQLLSRGATTYTRLAMGLPVRDATAGFRVYSARQLGSLDLDEVDSQGYCFQIDMTWRVYRAGGRIVEVPITFVERSEGQSKMSGAIVREALVKVTGWGAARRWQQLRGLVRPGPRSA
ncbi:polyprenol monophosphomannose synthase [Pseudactinotalea sp. HY158]|uniref:polyprenol monophosphomannose synthase n=1 Tax=Pseudactinotalea sp. HY158 TaxID=2654547 RepID=UPI00129CE614|nr:polyprenol monophosphomannose synthase [Pseudactinotalea sp. HY158]QGH69401.1 glycosyltransferase [Pseudactinotalea sp. HY158]